MASISGTQESTTHYPKVQNIFLIVGLACIAVFVANILTLAIPPDPMALEWRAAFMEKLSGRSLILLIGMGLLLYSIVENRSLANYVALASLVIGLLLPLSCVLVVRDHLVIQQQTFTLIEEKSQALQRQLDAVDVLPDQLQAASQQLTEQTDTLKQNARSTTSKSILSISGSLVVIGIGLLGLGRYGIKRTS